MPRISLEGHEERVFSQNGEDGVTRRIIDSLYGADCYYKCYVEFGVEDGCECNTRILREKYYWTGLLLDGGFERPELNLRKHFITRENIVQLLNQYHMPKRLNLLSVDVDRNDFYILDEILHHYRADVIICEYNSTHPPEEDKVVVYEPLAVWDFTDYFGASLLALSRMLLNHGYVLVYTDKMGVNAFFVDLGKLDERGLQFSSMADVSALYHPPLYGKNNNGHQPDPHFRKYVSSREALSRR
ncbi:MAG: hypothetical protein ACI9HK_002591 [Pirellulaceae bacterium]|jgi:hypothetical protein